MKVVSVEKITFLLPFEKTCVVDVPENVIAEFNKSLVEEKKGIYEMKVPNPDLKEEIMAQQLVFYSRFMGISLEELCGHTIKELESLVDSTLLQMPEETLQKFVDEIEGRKVEE